MQFWQSLLLGGVLATLTLPAGAISVTADDWTHSLTDNIRNAGEYYDSTISTSTNVNISGTTNSSEAWTLAVRLSSAVTGLSIAVKRTGAGSGDSIPSGGDSNVPLTTAFQNLFTGTGNVSTIPLEFSISNFDVSDGNGTKSIQIEYQVTATP